MNEIPSKKDFAKSGFTLIEILVAFVIAGILFGSFFAVYDRVLTMTSRVDDQNEVVQNGRLILWHMTQDILSLYHPDNHKETDDATSNSTWSSFSGQTAPPNEGLFNSPQRLMSFATTHSLNFNATFPQQCIVRVQYLIDKTSAPTNCYELIRKEIPYPYLKSKDTGPEITLSRSIESVDLKFHSLREEEPSDKWPPERFFQGNTKQANPPGAIQIRFGLVNEKGDIFPFQKTWVVNDTKKAF
jgi:prepilin-type N-terminal cleavage/methylation domain-containing protein